MEPQQLSFDYSLSELDYEIVFSRRKTLGLYVYPNGRIVVRAPNRTAKRVIVEFVYERERWALEKRKEFLALPQAPAIRYTNGATHHFLGEACQLELRPSTKNDISLCGRLIQVRTKNSAESLVKKQVLSWFRQQAKVVYAERAAELYPLFSDYDIPRPELSVRRYKSRWGSCSRDGAITLSLELVRYPVPLIDYVLVHEMCHLLEFNHSPRFYQVMTQILPDWKRKKVALESLCSKLGSLD